jgi:hypothetical protein
MSCVIEAKLLIVASTRVFFSTGSENYLPNFELFVG